MFLLAQSVPPNATWEDASPAKRIGKGGFLKTAFI